MIAAPSVHRAQDCWQQCRGGQKDGQHDWIDSNNARAINPNSTPLVLSVSVLNAPAANNSTWTNIDQYQHTLANFSTACTQK